ncbi:hypothetical protein BJX70DRAFT_361055 [Aspergillus crustosus]
MYSSFSTMVAMKSLSILFSGLSQSIYTQHTSSNAFTQSTTIRFNHKINPRHLGHGRQLSSGKESITNPWG